MTGLRTRNNIAVLDIGKTHAKVILFDALSHAELAVYETKNVVLTSGPYPHYDVDGLKAFITRALRDIAKSHPIDSLFTSTHGACVALMAKGELCMPVLDYEFDGPDQLAAEYDKIRPDFTQTGTPRMEVGLNLGAQLFWLNRSFSDAFEKVDQILFWPQFWSHWLSGVAATEISYASSHTDLWDIQQNTFVDLGTFGVHPRVSYPPIRFAGDIVGNLRAGLAEETGISSDTPVYCGGHDSSLSLAAARKNHKMPCTILSTGTWVTAFALGATKTDLPAQVGLMISCDCYGEIVPNFRFPGGQIYHDQTQGKGSTASLKPDVDLTTLRILDFDSFETARVVDKATGKQVDLNALEPDHLKTAISQLIAQQTMIGLKAIYADGPIICSGPFSTNQPFIDVLNADWNAPVKIEENHLGLCKGIASVIGV